MEDGKTCFFIGHREASDALLPSLFSILEHLIIEYRVTYFYVGGYGNFDRLAGKAVVALKARFPYIQLFQVIPYHPAERPIKTPAGYDGTYYPPGMEKVPRRLVIVRANRSLINTSDYLVAYVTHTASNAHQFLEYARRREQEGVIHVFNLGASVI